MGAKLSSRGGSGLDERYLKPAGRYAVKDSDLKKLKKKILDEKLAPFYRGVDIDDETVAALAASRGAFDLDSLEECPICFLSFPALNRSSN